MKINDYILLNVTEILKINKTLKPKAFSIEFHNLFMTTYVLMEIVNIS